MAAVHGWDQGKIYSSSISNDEPHHRDPRINFEQRFYKFVDEFRVGERFIYRFLFYFY